jgi:hypothetical protein
VGTLPIEAAMELADPSLLESLEELEEWWDEDPELLKAAIRACKKGSKGK